MMGRKKKKEEEPIEVSDNEEKNPPQPPKYEESEAVKKIRSVFQDGLTDIGNIYARAGLNEQPEYRYREEILTLMAGIWYELHIIRKSQQEE